MNMQKVTFKTNEGTVVVYAKEVGTVRRYEEIYERDTEAWLLRGCNLKYAGDILNDLLDIGFATSTYRTDKEKKEFSLDVLVPINKGADVMVDEHKGPHPKWYVPRTK